MLRFAHVTRCVSPIDRLLLFTANSAEEVELALIRNAGQTTLTLFRPARPGKPRLVVDSIGPGPEEPEEVRVMLNSFDIWALNAPNAPGAACRTVNGQRSCVITPNTYLLVMRVESGADVRVQRYSYLDLSTGNPTARALADFVLAWARKAEGGGEARRQPPPQPGSATESTGLVRQAGSAAPGDRSRHPAAATSRKY